MTKKDTSLDVLSVTGINLPAFMQNETIMGTEALSEFVIPPRIKIVQKQAGDELLAKFRVGDIILTPSHSIIVKAEYDENNVPKVDGTNSFNVIPIFFYPEWATWNPLKMKGQLPVIRYRTTDPGDPIVLKARNKKLREEPCPENMDLKIRHCEHLNYIVMLVDHELAGIPVVMSFSRGSWSDGSNFAGIIKMRNAPMYGCVFTLNLKYNKNQEGSWYTPTPSNPANRVGWVEDKEQYERYKALHLEFKEHHKNARLVASLEDEDIVDDPAATSASNDF